MPSPDVTLSIPRMSKSKRVSVCAVWPTAWGAMGAVSVAGRLVRTVLPHYQPDDLRQLLAFEHSPSREDAGPLAELIELTRAYFNGRPVGFDQIDCDLPAETTFTGRVLRACREIPYGNTLSYSQLAAAAGSPDGARAAAAAMGRNPLPLVIPCHRVIYADGRAGGFSAPAGVQQKRRMLALESAL